MIFKRKIAQIANFTKAIGNSQERVPYLKSKMTFKNLIKFGLLTTVFIFPFFNETNLNLSVSRLVSRLVGKIGDCKLPLSMRSTVLNSYINFYNVNKDEILDPELNNYETVKDFFIRKIKLEKRPIEDSSDEILSSPCDGRIFSFSEIADFDQIFFVKKCKDSLSSFLFSDFIAKNPSWQAELENKNKRYYQLTIYLSPGDCHRYYSPANMSVSHRLYIPGFLAPVKPAYVLKHPRTFSMNERVTLICKYLNKQKNNDVLYMTFVGALNVGSINLSFDQQLQTNKDAVLPGKSLDQGFYVADYKVEKIQESKEKGAQDAKNGYARSDKGFMFNKKDELGWFNFGSTIVLVFSCDKDKEIISKYKEGEQVKIGQSLIEVVKN